MEDMYDTSLSLGLGYDGTNQVNSSCKPEPQVSSPPALPEPALTLGLPEIALQSTWMKKADVKATSDFSLIAQSSSHSTASESSKRGSEEPERVSSRASDDEEDGSPRKKLRLTKQQSALLEDRFKEHSTLNPRQKQALAKQLNLRPRQVEVWFQNRRARIKTKQTEIDREFLRRCCEDLRDENRKLRKELRELKATKVASPWYTQFSRDSVVVCPSCDKVTGGGDYTVAPKPQLLNPFTGYTAC